MFRPLPDKDLPIEHGVRLQAWRKFCLLLNAVKVASLRIEVMQEGKNGLSFIQAQVRLSLNPTVMFTAGCSEV